MADVPSGHHSNDDAGIPVGLVRAILGTGEVRDNRPGRSHIVHVQPNTEELGDGG